MMWTPSCHALEKHNQFTPTFATYCANWMKIIYQLLWYVKDIEVNSDIIKSLEAAALAKLNQLHANQKYECKITNLHWDDNALILQPFEEKTAINGNSMDISLQSYKQYDMSDKSDSKDDNNKNEFEFANESRKEKEKKKIANGENKERVKKLLVTLNEMEITYHKLDLEIEKIDDKTRRKQIQSDINNQLDLVQQHVKQAQLFMKRLPTLVEISKASEHALQLAKNQEIISSQIVHIQIEQAKEFLDKHHT